jgi:hypothetical protein
VAVRNFGEERIAEDYSGRIWRKISQVSPIHQRSAARDAHGYLRPSLLLSKRDTGATANERHDIVELKSLGRQLSLTKVILPTVHNRLNQNWKPNACTVLHDVGAFYRISSTSTGSTGCMGDHGDTR